MTTLEAYEKKIKEMEERIKALKKEKEFIKKFCSDIIKDCTKTDIYNLSLGFFPAWISSRIAKNKKAVFLYLEITKVLVKLAQAEWVLKYQK